MENLFTDDERTIPILRKRKDQQILHENSAFNLILSKMLSIMFYSPRLHKKLFSKNNLLCILFAIYQHPNIQT